MSLTVLFGSAGSGKSTVERMVCESTDVFSFALASPIKDFAMAVFDFTDAQLYGPSEMRSRPDIRCSSREYWHACARRLAASSGESMLNRLAHPNEPSQAQRRGMMRWFDELRRESWQTGELTPRAVCQTFGTEYGRLFFGDDVWVNLGLSIMGMFKHHDTMISDGRFLNELECVKAAGARTVLVKRDCLVDAGSHQSESWIASAPEELFDVVIYNNGTVEELRKKVSTVFRTNR